MQLKWPSHALVFRSLNERESGPLIQALGLAGARLIPSRQVWWFEPGSKAVDRSRDLRKDMNLLRRGDVRLVRSSDLRMSDFPRIKELYDQLYLHKYSRWNPRYSEKWLSHLWEEGLLQYTGLQYGNQWAGVEACGEINGVMVSPIVGYDLRLPKSLALYRRLAALPVLDARERGIVLNLSAGVGKFKRLRGGEPLMEYVAVVDSHLPSERILPWRFIEAFSRAVLAPAVRRLGL
jgi:hypothetical protein